MKLMMFAALAAAVATPALAQTMPAPAQDPAMAQPAPPAPPADPAVAATPPAPPAAPTTTPDANMSAATPAAPMPATGTYPPCSRSVTDQCTERSNARGERLHSRPRKR